MLTEHVQALLGITRSAANRRLRGLRSAGLLAPDPGTYRLPYHAITRRGLTQIASDLPPPRPDSSVYWHDIGVAWLWLAAKAGRFGPLDAIVSERTMRSHDGARGVTAGSLAEPFGVRYGGYGPRGHGRLHYPDLVLRTEAGHTVAIEFEHSAKGRARRERILGGYAVDRRIDAVLYLVEHPTTGAAIKNSAARLGLSELVHVQRFEWDPKIRPPGRGVVSERSRTATHEHRSRALEVGR